MGKKLKPWIIGGVALAVALSFALNRSLQKTVERRWAIRRAAKDYAALSIEVNQARQRIQDLENNPSSYETLIRSELGYLRPGEREVRFVKRT